jgi:hypothetical protein
LWWILLLLVKAIDGRPNEAKVLQADGAVCQCTGSLRVIAIFSGLGLRGFSGAVLLITSEALLRTLLQDFEKPVKVWQFADCF